MGLTNGLTNDMKFVFTKNLYLKYAEHMRNEIFADKLT